MIVITIDGGLVQGISSDEPKLVGQEVIVIDYDAEGADAGEVQKVPQGKGKTEDAGQIGRLLLDYAQLAEGHVEDAPGFAGRLAALMGKAAG